MTVFEYRGGHMRRCTLSHRKVRVPSPAVDKRTGNHFPYGGDVRPGEWVAWQYDDDSQRFMGRVIGRVDAPDDGPHCPAVKGWLAVLRFDIESGWANIYWVDPAHVRSIFNPPKAMLALLLTEQDAFPSLREICYRNDYGSLREEYVHQVNTCRVWTYVSEDCRRSVRIGPMPAHPGGNCRAA